MPSEDVLGGIPVEVLVVYYQCLRFVNSVEVGVGNVLHLPLAAAVGIDEVEKGRTGGGNLDQEGVVVQLALHHWQKIEDLEV